MYITSETTIEEMRKEFAMVTMQVVEGEYKVDHIFGSEEGKETIRLKGVDGSWIDEAQFDSNTKRSVLHYDSYAIRPLDVWPAFYDCDYPESLKVGDRICCVCSKFCSDPWKVSYWVPEWIYEQFLTRMKAKYGRSL